MSYPQPVYEPPFNITRAGHMVLTSRDLARARHFYTNVIGLVVTKEDGDTLWLRGLEEIAHHSLVIKRTSGQPMCERIGLRVLTETELEKAHRHYRSLGLDPRSVEVPHQGRTLHVTDPFGVPYELTARMDRVDRAIMRQMHHAGGTPLRFDHLQLHLTEVRRAVEFYTALGFRTSDYLVAGPDDEITGAFLHRKDIPWDLVFLRGTGPRMHHFAYVVPNAVDMFRACDSAGLHKYGPNVEFGPGRHGMGHVQFTYFRDPDGHRIELCLEAPHLMTDLENEPVRWDIEKRRNAIDWGFPPPQRWYDEASHFPGIEPKVMPMTPGRVALETYLAGFGR